ncbi:DUF559 domain-containing protein [Cryobacterium tagatosivorans]|uniref:DUF559 domain-containing protein n=1 Tax=Cryobacterium tagatosivorans TaxID=1259199 RepID=A0A4R8UDG1_9MICO|nr:DUF559 domain-containing protein [Cryobacterium tagatosivorans]TFB50323.1 DUF559 domain-containing protein [Cryobacterium tagatosivorans]
MTARVPLPDEFSDRPFLTATARDAGVGPSRLRGADLYRPFWGIRSPAPPAPAGAPGVAAPGADASAAAVAVEALCRALALRMPPHAFFTHETAAQLLRLPLPRAFEAAPPLHVGMPAPARAMDARGVVGHSMRIRADDVVVWQGLRFTGPARTWLDLAARLSLVDLVAAGDYLVQWRRPLATLDELADAVARYPSRRGLARARDALPLVRTRSESRRETKLRVAIVLGGLPEPECNLNIYDPDGRLLARADLAYPEFRLLLEYQGDHHRTDRAQWRRDIRRVGSLEDQGWQVLQFTDDDLRDPAALLARIELRLRGRGWTGTRRPPD